MGFEPTRPPQATSPLQKGCVNHSANRPKDDSLNTPIVRSESSRLFPICLESLHMHLRIEFAALLALYLIGLGTIIAMVF